MSDSLRDQLLGLGFKAPARPARTPGPDTGRARAPSKPPTKPPTRPAGGRTRGGAPRRKAGEADDIDLAKAYAIRAQREKRERLEAERAKQEAAARRREARARFDAYIDGKALNDPSADIARHFEYGGKIKRVHVNAEQLRALNAGELGVLQQKGRYLLVSAAVLAEAKAIFADGVALEVDPGSEAGSDPASDPTHHPVPDDLVW